MIPEGSKPLANTKGTAPGIAAKIGNARIFVIPGVPYEMREMFTTQIAPRLTGDGEVILHRTIHTFGLGESDLAVKIADLMNSQTEPAVGTTVASGIVSIRITSRGADAATAKLRIENTAREIRSRLGQFVLGQDEQTMASVIGSMLSERKMSLAVAESCTGGLLGEMITRSPGSSEYFLGGVIAYANKIKQQLLGVDENVLQHDGAVSEPVAAAMADGCRRLLAADYGISITGIAGPGGSSDQKPVGLVYIALATEEGTEVHKHQFARDRGRIRMRAALTALNFLRLKLTPA